MRRHLPGLFTGLLAASLVVPVAAIAATGGGDEETLLPAQEQEHEQDPEPDPEQTPADLLPAPVDQQPPPAAPPSAEDDPGPDEEVVRPLEAEEMAADDQQDSAGHGASVRTLARCAPRGQTWHAVAGDMTVEQEPVRNRGGLLRAVKDGLDVTFEGTVYSLPDELEALCGAFAHLPAPADAAAARGNGPKPRAGDRPGGTGRPAHAQGRGPTG